MNRKDFFKKLGIGLGVAMTAPQVLAETPSEESAYSSGSFTQGDLDEIKSQLTFINNIPLFYSPCINDMVLYFGEMYVVVAIVSDKITLRPFEIKEDIILHKEDFEVGRAVVITNLFNGHDFKSHNSIS